MKDPQGKEQHIAAKGKDTHPKVAIEVDDQSSEDEETETALHGDTARQGDTARPQRDVDTRNVETSRETGSQGDMYAEGMTLRCDEMERWRHAPPCLASARSRRLVCEGVESLRDLRRVLAEEERRRSIAGIEKQQALSKSRTTFSRFRSMVLKSKPEIENTNIYQNVVAPLNLNINIFKKAKFTRRHTAI